ncbi:DUF2213 domain-containing protein [Sphingobium sp. H39-3-25]|uniref:DUF2213 domain-containing protein n=1 Tax=Sphingobium arseniciresistens TaxID=3030834 RepID=UPI0023BA1022|nr:DUF2213 domain-containing protein [Sphingobium arseniciresistens]
MLFDRATIDGPARITRDGYLVGDALVGRADNIQDYRASELGLTDRAPNDVVRIFRPASEVFHKDALASLAHRPVTINHPADAVTSSNWKDHARGDVGGDIMRDGEFIRVPFKIMDHAAVDAVRTTHGQFSLGYTADIDMTPGIHDGAAYDGSARSFRYNHLAAVPVARGGSELRIVDERHANLRDDAEGAISWLKKAISLHKKHMNGTAPTTGKAGDESQKLMMEQMEKALSELQPGAGKSMKMGDSTMKINIGDAKDVDLSDGAAVALAVGALNTTLSDAQKAIGGLTADNATLKAAVETKDGEIAALKQQVSDAAITPEKLQQLADARADVIGKAKQLAPQIVTDGKSDADIRKEAVTAKLGDAAKDMSDDAISGAFAAFTKDGAPASGVHPLGQPKVIGDAATGVASARKAWLANKQSAYRGQAA